MKQQERIIHCIKFTTILIVLLYIGTTNCLLKHTPKVNSKSTTPTTSTYINKAGKDAKMTCDPINDISSKNYRYELL